MGAFAVLATKGFTFGSTGPFVGAMSEGFESFPNYIDNGFSGVDTLVIMGGGATFNGNNDMWVIEDNVAGWGLGNNGSAYAYTGVKELGMFNNSTNTVTLTFSTAVSAFGGYFQTCDASYGTFDLWFYDGGNNLLGTESFTTGSAHEWRGWEHAAGIAYVLMSGNAAPAMDDLQANAVPEPATLAALGLGAAAMLRRRKKS